MENIYQSIVSSFYDYQSYFELVAAVTGVAGVYFSYKRNILVYIVSFISSAIYVCLLYDWELFGDMLLNFYYLVINVIGFFAWIKHFEGDSKIHVYVTKANNHQKKISLYIFIITFVITPFIYALQKQTYIIDLPIYSFIDAFVTAISFAGAYLLIKRAIENWYLWAIADIISVPLFIYKGYNVTALQYAIFLILVYLGYKEWLRDYKQNKHYLS
ncbi:nicotinamide riboside transporter PnuC [Francisella hispaniensis]|uniref:nicotinamide riboside transporter PnuC n=1 Tax=Francisella hispaniensis TaxID=622488 RepID=UPI0007AA0146|nr:nicotinamide riboside transporter PnuC [Francisella hispaniensis]KYW82671.1 hypothetical protein AUF42_08110 [Francisella hispaniensis FSC454]